MVAASAELSGLVAEELQKNEQLRATLQSMGGGDVATGRTAQP